MTKGFHFRLQSLKVVGFSGGKWGYVYTANSRASSRGHVNSYAAHCAIREVRQLRADVFEETRKIRNVHTLHTDITQNVHSFCRA